MKISVPLPPLHPAQRMMLKAVDGSRRNALAFGRRSGKSYFLSVVTARAILRGEFVGYLAPQSRHLDVPLNNVIEILKPLGSRVKVNRQAGIISIPETGGTVTFIPTEVNQDRARGQTYHWVLVDEAGFIRDTDGEFKYLLDAVLRPTLMTTEGTLVLASTPNGINNTFFDCFHDSTWSALTAPSHCNPDIPAEELALMEKQLDPRIYQQEILARFLDFSSESWFQRDKAYIDGQPAPYPTRCDYVIAICDSALKSGPANDGTCVIFVGHTEHVPPGCHRTVVLDWELVQLNSDLLLTTYPSWVDRGEELAKACGARMGFGGLFIEDKGSGVTMIQAGRAACLPVKAIDSKLTAKSKDDRAKLASHYYSNNLWKISQYAHDKTSVYKGRSRNHFTGQLFEYRVNDPQAHRRQDDALDCATYSMIICNTALSENN